MKKTTYHLLQHLTPDITLLDSISRINQRHCLILRLSRRIDNDFLLVTFSRWLLRLIESFSSCGGTVDVFWRFGVGTTRGWGGGRKERIGSCFLHECSGYYVVLCEIVLQNPHAETISYNAKKEEEEKANCQFRISRFVKCYRFKLCALCNFERSLCRLISAVDLNCR